MAAGHVIKKKKTLKISRQAKIPESSQVIPVNDILVNYIRPLKYDSIHKTTRDCFV